MGYLELSPYSASGNERTRVLSSCSHFSSVASVSAVALVVMDGLLKQFQRDAAKCYSCGNVPLHLFLESCLVERARDIARGYARDIDDYCDVVKRCLQLILNANPRATSQLNDAGLLPLHVAVKGPAILFRLMQRWIRC